MHVRCNGRPRVTGFGVERSTKKLIRAIGPWPGLGPGGDRDKAGLLSPQATVLRLFYIGSNVIKSALAARVDGHVFLNYFLLGGSTITWTFTFLAGPTVCSTTTQLIIKHHSKPPWSPSLLIPRPSKTSNRPGGSYRRTRAVSKASSAARDGLKNHLDGASMPLSKRPRPQNNQPLLSSSAVCPWRLT